MFILYKKKNWNLFPYIFSHFRGINNVFGSLKGEGKGEEMGGEWYLFPLFECYYKIKYGERNKISSFIWMF